MSNPIERDNLMEMYNTLWSQLQEDRELALHAYNDLKSQTTTKEDYAIQGLVLSKLAELCLKQTAQLIEVVKINQKEVTKNDVSLGDDDKKDIFKEIGN